MKKFSLFLALLTVLTICVSSFSIGISAAPLDAFTQVEPIPEENQINSTTWNHLVGMNIAVDPNGTWSWANDFEGKDSCWGQNQGVTFLDSNYKTVIVEYKDVDYSDKDATSVREIVFTDIHTQSGLGSYGRVRATAETFEKMSVCYSQDGENWTEIGFTVAYNTAAGTYTDWRGNIIPVDTYWHLVFEEEAPAAKFFAIITSESRAWDADDFAPALGAVLDWKYFYLVKGSGEVGAPVTPVTAAPETNAPETNAPETNAPETNAPETNAPETGAPETNEPEAPAENDMTWLYIVIAAAVVVVVVVVIVVAKKKK